MHGRDSSQKPILANVRAASPSVARGAGFANLVAAVAILVALFPPFVNQHCSVCTAAVAATLPVGALGRGADGWVFIWLGCLVGITAIGFLLGIGSRLAAIANGVSSLAALALAIFEGASAFPRVVADAQLVRGMGSLTWTLDSGFYLLLSAALLAVVTTLIMNVLPKQEGFELSRRVLARASTAVVAGWACVASLCAVGVGLLLPFAKLSCFACPSFTDDGSWSGSLISGSDGWIALVIVGLGVLAIIMGIAGRAGLAASWSAVLLCLLTLALVSFEIANASTRVLGWPTWIPTVPEQGYAVIVAGAAVASACALVMVTCNRRVLPRPVT